MASVHDSREPERASAQARLAVTQSVARGDEASCEQSGIPAIRDPARLPVAAAALQRMQQSLGNRATERFLERRRATDPTRSLTVQRKVRPWIAQQVQTIDERIDAGDYESVPASVDPDQFGPAAPGGAFYYLNGLQLSDLVEAFRAMNDPHRKKLRANWSKTAKFDVPRFNLAWNVAQSDAQLSEQVQRLHHFIRGEMWDDAFGMLNKAKPRDLPRIVAMLSPEHAQELVRHHKAAERYDHHRLLLAVGRRAGDFSSLAADPNTDPALLEGLMQQKTIDDMNNANQGKKTQKTGVWYPWIYKAKYPQAYAAHPDWSEGYTDGPFDRIGHMHWLLRPRVSASAALQAWLKGLTIAECASLVNAIQYDTIRATIGNAKFDERFGRTDIESSKGGRLRIAQSPLEPLPDDPPGTQHPTPLGQFMHDTDAAIYATKGGDVGRPGNRPLVQKGEWYYFRNHSSYKDKHPRGGWQGENCICMDDAPGRQLWSGLGANNVTEDQMLAIVVEHYNRPQTAEDKRNATGRPFPDQVKAEDVLKNGGGIDLKSGWRLDPKQMKTEANR